MYPYESIMNHDSVLMLPDLSVVLDRKGGHYFSKDPTEAWRGMFITKYRNSVPPQWLSIKIIGMRSTRTDDILGLLGFWHAFIATRSVHT